MPLFRNARTLLESDGWVSHDLDSGSARIVPMDHDADDRSLDLVVWAELHAKDDPRMLDSQGPKLVVELSTDGKTWMTASELAAREQPVVEQMRLVLPFIRARVIGVQGQVQARVRTLSSVPFHLRVPHPRGVIVVTAGPP
jgi:hypothetical protein